MGFFEAIDRFWMRSPALLYAFALATGIFAAIKGEHVASALVGAVLIAPVISSRPLLRARLLLALCIGICGFAYAASSYRFPEMGEAGVEGVAEFQPETIRRSTGRYHKGWVYTGKIITFTTQDGVIAKNIPANVSVREENRPNADCTYQIRSRLKKSMNGNYFLVTPRNGDRWVPLPDQCGYFCELRYRLKSVMSGWIKDKIGDPLSGTFLAGIATGSFDDNEMFVELGRFGLQHIMAISGFHFAIIAAIVGRALRMVLPLRFSVSFLIVVMSSYFLFLGPGASIVRAWLTVVIALAAALFNRSTNGLNTLGAAALLILLYDPLMVGRIGFQFSALMTLAILLYYPLAEEWIRRWIPKRTPGVAIRMAFYDQYGCILMAFVKSAVALTIAVNLFAIPLTLLYFHKFPVMGLLYNLFFPFMVSISMLLLILGLAADLLLPFIGSSIHFLNNIFTSFILNFVYQMPTNIDMMIRMESVSGVVVALFFCVWILGGIVVRHRLESQKRFLGEWNFS